MRPTLPPDVLSPINHLANHLADESARITREYFGTPIDIITKADETPVTIAYRTIEKALRDILDRERPDDGIIGEEFGTKDGRSGYTWVLDPIDGTKSFTIPPPPPRRSAAAPLPSHGPPRRRPLSVWARGAPAEA